MMHRILVVTSDPKRLAEFANALKASLEIHVAWADSGAAALSDVMKHPPLGVIVDETLPDMPGLELVRRLLPINAMINTAVISSLPDAAFHETGEGLGILAQLSPIPTESQARELLAQLKRLHAATASVGHPLHAPEVRDALPLPDREEFLWFTSAWVWRFERPSTSADGVKG